MLHPTLQNFIREHCVLSPMAVAPLALLFADFRQRLPADERRRWTRGRLIRELAGAFTIGELDQALCAGGVALKATRWAVDSRGHLEASHV